MTMIGPTWVIYGGGKKKKKAMVTVKPTKTIWSRVGQFLYKTWVST